MKVKAGLVGAVLVLGLNGVAHAVNMIAGPLSGDACSCYIVNVSSSPKPIDVQGLDKGGNIHGTLSKTLAAGQTDGVGIGVGGAQYCKFLNASPTNFRAAIQCFIGTSVFTLPAR